MPFMEHMLNVLARSFGKMTALPLADKLAFVENKDKKARMLRCASVVLGAGLPARTKCRQAGLHRRTWNVVCCCCDVVR